MTARMRPQSSFEALPSSMKHSRLTLRPQSSLLSPSKIINKSSME